MQCSLTYVSYIMNEKLVNVAYFTNILPQWP